MAVATVATNDPGHESQKLELKQKRTMSQFLLDDGYFYHQQTQTQPIEHENHQQIQHQEETHAEQHENHQHESHEQQHEDHDRHQDHGQRQQHLGLDEDDPDGPQDVLEPMQTLPWNDQRSVSKKRGLHDGGQVVLELESLIREVVLTRAWPEDQNGDLDLFPASQQQQWKCLICSATFAEKAETFQHIRVAHSKTSQEDEEEVDEFATLNDNGQVEALHHARRKLYKCPICENQFGKRSDLKVHIEAVHECKRPHICKTCQEGFPYQSHLKRHVETVHENRKPYACEYCPKKFSQKPHLQEHTRSVHLGVKPFQCEVCNSFFKHKASLRKHIRTIHGNERVKCPYCHKEFTQQANLKVHVQSIHANTDDS